MKRGACVPSCQMAGPVLLVAVLTFEAGCTRERTELAERPTGAETTQGLEATKKAGPTLRFGVLPAVDLEAQRKLYAPLIAELSQLFGRAVELVTPRDYAALFAELDAGAINLAQMSAYIYIKTAWSGKLPTQVIAFEEPTKGRRHRGVIVVSRDSPLESLTALKGKRFAFVDRFSSSGYYYARIRMRELGLDPDNYFGEVRFAGSHNKVVEAVKAGLVDAGAVSELTFTQHQGLRTLERTDVIPEDAIVCLQGLSTKQMAELTPFLLEMHKNSRLAGFMKARGIRRYVPGNVTVFAAQKREMEREVAQKQP